MVMSLLLSCLIITFTSRIHGIIGALREAILALSIVRNDCTVYSTRIIGGNAPDHDPISPR